MKNNASLLAILTLLIFGCKKSNEPNPDTVFQGKVMVYETTTPIEGATVTLHRADHFSQENGFVNEVTESTVSDENGNFKFSIENGNKGVYKYTAAKNGWIKARDLHIGTLITKNSTHTDTAYMGKKTYFKLNIKNIEPLNPDSVECRVLKPIKGFNMIGVMLANINSKVINDTTLNCTVLYEESPHVTVFWRIRNNGILSNGLETINLEKQKTTEYTLEY